MATEEVNKPPPTLPPYPEMILAAISGLDEKTGSNKSSISDYIESQYGDLPSSHAALLSYHLTKMKDDGEITMVKNNYMRANPDAPPKRGRGRPPKPKTAAQLAAAEAEATVVAGPPRPRGRPPKDPSMGPQKRKVPESSGRPRGRPKKVKADNEGDEEAPVPAKVISGSPRPRGRPPKVKASFGAVGSV